MAKKRPKDGGHKHKLVGLRLEESFKLKIQAMADAERRSLASMCAILIEEAFQARTKK
jgi:hypothetical protein